MKSVKKFEDFFNFYVKFMEVKKKINSGEQKNSADQAKNTILAKCTNLR